jgi:hypothetical protein
MTDAEKRSDLFLEGQSTGDYLTTTRRLQVRYRVHAL